MHNTQIIVNERLFLNTLGLLKIEFPYASYMKECNHRNIIKEKLELQFMKKNLKSIDSIGNNVCFLREAPTESVRILRIATFQQAIIKLFLQWSFIRIP